MKKGNTHHNSIVIISYVSSICIRTTTFINIYSQHVLENNYEKKPDIHIYVYTNKGVIFSIYQIKLGIGPENHRRPPVNTCVRTRVSRRKPPKKPGQDDTPRPSSAAQNASRESSLLFLNASRIAAAASVRRWLAVNSGRPLRTDPVAPSPPPPRTYYMMPTNARSRTPIRSN